jgi:hypothetical protein
LPPNCAAAHFTIVVCVGTICWRLLLPKVHHQLLLLQTIGHLPPMVLQPTLL